MLLGVVDAVADHEALGHGKAQVLDDRAGLQQPLAGQEGAQPQAGRAAAGFGLVLVGSILWIAGQG